MIRIFCFSFFVYSFSLFAQLYSSGQGVIDFDGNSYPTIIINGQEWMSENLRTTSYSNGDPIGNVDNENFWAVLNNGAWAYNYNDASNEYPYGKLYNWYAVIDNRNICPIGWHVPNKNEYTVIIDYIGGESIAGGKMKSTGTQYWQIPNTDATNESGFSGLPGGSRSEAGVFQEVGNNGTWWSSSESTTFNSWSWIMSYNIGNAGWCNCKRRVGSSVRCIKNNLSSITEINNQNKLLIKITDLIGRETVQKTNEILLYHYSDGSIEKIFNFE
jgi:uncharacterized protein (TIGR02145 family)